MSTPFTSKQSEQQPLSPFRWFVLATLLVVTSTTALALICPAPLTAEILASYPDLTAGQVTWMTMGIFNLFTALSALGGGYFVDKLGFVKIYLFGVTLILIGTLLMPVLGDQYWGVVFIRMLQGLGTGPIMASCASLAATYFPTKERGIVTGVQGAGMSLGIAVGLQIVPDLFDSTGAWETALRSLWPLSVVALIMATVVAFGPKPVPFAEEALADELTPEQERAELKKAMLAPATWAAIGCVVLLSWVYQAFNDLTPGYLSLDAPVGLGRGAHGSQLLVWAQAANIIGSLVCGYVTLRVFRGKVRPGMVLGFTLGAVFGAGLLLSSLKDSDPLLIVVLAIAAFFMAWINPNALAFIARTYPPQITGKIGGMAMGIGIFGGTAGVAAGARALHVTGRYTVSIIIMVTVSLVGAAVAATLRQPGPATAEDVTGSGTNEGVRSQPA